MNTKFPANIQGMAYKDEIDNNKLGQHKGFGNKIIRLVSFASFDQSQRFKLN